MANSDFLRANRNQHGAKNSLSKGMDKAIDVAIKELLEFLKNKYPDLKFEHLKTLRLQEIILNLSLEYPQFSKEFSTVMEESFIKPDGGFLFATDKDNNKKLILVSEIKRQGTNDKRKIEGLPKQAKGNAIERLGKNLTGIRAIFRNEKIIPFVCFGSGHDFMEGSTITDRVITMNDFFPLNKVFIKKDYLPFEPVSLFFRYEDWSKEEMLEKMKEISEFSIKHYFNF